MVLFHYLILLLKPNKIHQTNKFLFAPKIILSIEYEPNV